MIRDFVLLPVISLYAMVLVLAAWPTEIRPSFLDGASRVAFDTLWSVGIKAGMAVFPGSKEELRLAIRSRCIYVTGTDSKGKQTQIHPTEPCPTRGFRWKPDVYHHMIFHWVWMIVKARDSSNLWAMGDHFCHLNPDQDFQYVTITRLRGMMAYDTGYESGSTRWIGRVECRP